MNKIAADIIRFWYIEENKKQWFQSTPELDALITQKFAATWQDAANGKYADWMQEPLGCLALIILLDQFPLNMFRGQAKSFSTEQKAIEVAWHAVKHDFDKSLDRAYLAFLYMPFMHSEQQADQDLSVKLYEEANLLDNLRFARHHRSIIERFGRFPHRNKILERESTAEEITYLESADAFHG